MVSCKQNFFTCWSARHDPGGGAEGLSIGERASGSRRVGLANVWLGPADLRVPRPGSTSVGLRKRRILCATAKIPHVPGADISGSFDQFGCAYEQRKGNGQAKCFRCFEVNREFKCDSKLQWKFGWLVSLQNAIHISGSTPKQVREVWPVAE